MTTPTDPVAGERSSGLENPGNWLICEAKITMACSRRKFRIAGKYRPDFKVTSKCKISFPSFHRLWFCFIPSYLCCLV